MPSSGVLAGLRVNGREVRSTMMERMHAVKNSPKAREQWFYRTGFLFGCNFTWCIIISWHWHLIGRRTWISDTSTWSIWKKKPNKQKQTIFFPLSRRQVIAQSQRIQPIGVKAKKPVSFFFFSFFFFFFKSFLWLLRAEETKKNLSMNHTGWAGRGGAGLCGRRGGEIT